MIVLFFIRKLQLSEEAFTNLPMIFTMTAKKNEQLTWTHNTYISS